ncbi:MAG: hypothetical protein JNL96_27550 [Planctomycetaceae bacterium]|nr:hypothetical protein [Planctomycetaceae bacterium]
MTSSKRWMSVNSGILAVAAMPVIFAVAVAQTPRPTASPSPTKPATTAQPQSANQKATSAATSPTISPTPVQRTELGKQVRAAAKQFHDIAPSDVAAARNALQHAIVELDQFLATIDPSFAAGWKEYLRFDALVAEVWKAGDVDTAALFKLQRRYWGGFVGLEQPAFQNVAARLMAFTKLAEAAQNKTLEADYEKHLNQLADTIDAVAGKAPTPEQADAIAADLAWLEASGQATDIVEKLGARYSQPNLLVDVSETLVEESLGRSVDQTEPVVDCILGTSIRGSGRTIGQVSVELIPNTDQAQLQTQLHGVNYSRTVGTNRSALIYSRGQTTLHGTSTLFVSDQGLTTGPVQAQASVRNQITGFGSTRGGLLGNIVKKIAAKKAPKQQGQAQQIAAAHARTKLAGSMQRQIVELVGDANAEIENKFRKPLLRFGQYPAQLQYATTDDAIVIRARQTTRGRLAAPGSAPEAAVGSPISVRLHQSLITNSTQGMLAGRKFDQQRIQLLAESLLGEMPERLQPKPGEEPFSITFADTNPVSLSFADDSATFTIRGKAFTSGDKSYDGMNITGVYKLSSDGHGLKAVRQGDFDIVPPDFKRGSGQRLNTRQIVLKRILTEKFGKAFPAEIVRDGTAVKDEQSDLGTMYVSSLRADGDWLVLGVNREAPGVAGQTTHNVVPPSIRIVPTSANVATVR